MKGGVGIFVRKTLNAKVLGDIRVIEETDSEFESIFLEIVNSGKPAIVGEIYRVPNANPNISIERFEVVLGANKI